MVPRIKKGAKVVDVGTDRPQAGVANLGDQGFSAAISCFLI